jgi:1-acyl-sn-glycerol-3-phosphate acyltransferase
MNNINKKIASLETRVIDFIVVNLTFFIVIVLLPMILRENTIRFTQYIFLGLVLEGMFTNNFKEVFHIAPYSKKETIFDKCVTPLLWLSFVTLLLFSLLTIPPMIVFLVSKKTRKLNDGILFYLDKACLRTLAIKVRIHGSFPKGLFVGAADHESSFDYFWIILALRFAVSKVVAGSNLLKLPIFNLFIGLKCLFVNRKDKKSKYRIVDKAIKCLKQSISVIFFVEGTRKRKKDIDSGVILKDFLPGAFEVGVSTNTQIVPIVVHGAAKCKPPMKKDPTNKQWWSSPGIIDVYILEPIQIESRNKNQLKDFTREVMLDFKSKI